jgi:7,8-dihydropterin-6-yl-methyl-4-(beta-D-ribofuranosyl)aminobenzene 5'-phosphate synthase
MVRHLRITVLVNNWVHGSDLLAEHGWAVWIEADGQRILFDTGQGMVLRQNAKHLKIALEAVETVVISHGHFDHTGGLKEVLDCRGRVSVYLHPAALEKKYARGEKPPHRSIGIPDRPELLRSHLANLRWTRTSTELADGVYVTGQIPRHHELEDVGGPFFRDPSCNDPDPLLDDQALYVDTPLGLVVVLGCAHSGVINTLDYVAELSPRRPIHAVLGGMHLVRASVPRLEATVEALRRHGVQKVGPAHCTGTRAESYLWSQLPGECFECSVGNTLVMTDEAP